MVELSPITRDCRRAIARIALGFFGFFAVTILAQLGIIARVRTLAPTLLESTLFSWAASLLPMYLLGAPILLLAVWRLPRTEIPVRRIRIRDFLVLFLIAFAVMYLSNLIGTAINWVTDLLLGTSSQAGALELITSSSLLLSVPIAVILAPILEEAIFRGLILPRLMPFGEGFAVLVSALLFGFFASVLSKPKAKRM